MTREEAIKIVQSATVWTDEERDALAMLIPELAESEDERIRKELIEQVGEIVPAPYETDDNGIILKSYFDRIARYRSWLEKQKEQKPSIFPPGFGEVRWNPISSVQQKPSEWSEEDERKYQCIRSILLTDMDKKIGSWKYSEILEWYEKRGIGRYINSQPHWKPSEEQLEAAQYVSQFDYGGHKAALVSLYEQLKKL